MIKLLISIKNVEEALQAEAAGADFIDIKNPEIGALGDLGEEATQAIMQSISKHTIVSATIGDEHQSEHQLIDLVEQKAKQGISIIKLPISNYLRLNTVSNQLKRIKSQYGVKLIAVINANVVMDLSWLKVLNQIGFYGAMLDTFDKHTTLLQVQTIADIQLFVNQCKMQGLYVGLAGSLKPEMLADLTPFYPNYLGFRSGVCEKNMRKNKLVPDFVKHLKDLLQLSCINATV